MVLWGRVGGEVAGSGASERRGEVGVAAGDAGGGVALDVAVGRQFGYAGRVAAHGGPFRRGLASDGSGTSVALSPPHHGRETAPSGAAQRGPGRMAQSYSRSVPIPYISSVEPLLCLALS